MAFSCLYAGLPKIEGSDSDGRASRTIVTFLSFTSVWHPYCRCASSDKAFRFFRGRVTRASAGATIAASDMIYRQ
jgi:hypothetical protein